MVAKVIGVEQIVHLRLKQKQRNKGTYHKRLKHANYLAISEFCYTFASDNEPLKQAGDSESGVL